MLKSKDDRLVRAAAKRAASRTPDAPPRRRATAVADAIGDEDELAGARPSAAGLSTTVRATSGLNHPPRPRKKRRR
jgi:hypothetical protein